jgi:predicted XRE-type DNA-binding protein
MSGPIYYDNIFEAVSDDPMEVFDLTLRADLIDTIHTLIGERQLTHGQIAEVLNVPAPRVSELMRGKISLLTVPKLIGYLGLLGYRLKPAAAPDGTVNCEVQHMKHEAA